MGSAIDNFVRLWHDTYGVKDVCVCRTIMHQGAVVFNRKAKLLTKYLRVVLEPIPYAILWGHRTFTHVMVCISIPWVRKNTIVVLEEQS